jgi:F1F0 ATPase subunit 2
MKNLILLIVSLPAGLLLGTIFYGGLWITVQKGVGSKFPALWFFLSFLIRIGTALAGFYFISSGHWERLILCFIGFLIARFVITKLTKSSVKEVSNEN